jgi:hypothetical protein
MEILKSLPQSRITRSRSLNRLSRLHPTTLCRSRATCRIIQCRSLKSLRQGPTNHGSKLRHSAAVCRRNSHRGIEIVVKTNYLFLLCGSVA